MKTKKIAELMNSKDYKERFQGEYFALKDRVNKLESILDTMQIDLQEGDYTWPCQIEIYRAQFGAMSAYLNILKIRAKIEGIDIREWSVFKD